MLVADVVLLLAVGAVALLAGRALGLPAIVAYLVAGVLVGPGGAGLVPRSDAVSELAELGVALLLFGVGIEFSLDPAPHPAAYGRERGAPDGGHDRRHRARVRMARPPVAGGAAHGLPRVALEHGDRVQGLRRAGRAQRAARPRRRRHPALPGPRDGADGAARARARDGGRRRGSRGGLGARRGRGRVGGGPCPGACRAPAGASRYPSRSASTTGRRAIQRAGSTPAGMLTRNAATAAAGRLAMLTCRSTSHPSWYAKVIRTQRTASAAPMTRPPARPRNPTPAASPTTERAIWPRVAPAARSSANSRRRSSETAMTASARPSPATISGSTSSARVKRKARPTASW